MKILITGANGQLGKFLHNNLSKRHDVTALTREEFDITNFQSMPKIIEGYDVIINCAAYTNVVKAETDDNNFRINLDAPIEMYKNLSDGQKIILFTSMAAFNPSKDGKMFSSNAITQDPPSQKYGMAKRELDIFAKNAKYKNIALIRPAWLHSSGKQNFITKMNSINSNTLSISSDDIGQLTTGSMILDLINYLLINWEDGAYNIAVKKPLSRFDLYKKYLEIKGIEKEIIPVSMEKFGIDPSTLNYQFLDIDNIPNEVEVGNIQEEIVKWIQNEEEDE